MHLIARKSSEQRCSLFQGQIQYYHKHFCFMYSKWMTIVIQLNIIGIQEKEGKKEVYSSRRIPFSQDSTKSQNWVREKKSTNNLFMDTKHLNCMLIKRNGYFGSSVNRSIWLLGVFYQWFIITVQTKSCFGSWNVSNIRIVCLAIFFLPSL